MTCPMHGGASECRVGRDSITPGRGAGGGGAAGAGRESKRATNRSLCRISAIGSTSGRIVLDALGGIPGASAANVILQSALISYQSAIAVVQGDGKQGAFAGTSFALLTAQAAQPGSKKLAQAIGKSVPIVGQIITLYSIGDDFIEGQKAYRACGQ